jgi:hypothetical protein
MAVMPEIVSTGTDPDGLLSMNYSEIVPVLVNAIQEQQGQIESQEEQIHALEARLSALESAQNSLSSSPGLSTNFNVLWLVGLIGSALFVVVGQRRKGGQP